MSRIIQLLNYKLHFLEKILSLNEIQWNLLQLDHWESLPEFFEKRERLIQILNDVDYQIKKASENYLVTNQEMTFINQYEKTKSQYAERILQLETMILSWLENWKKEKYKQIQQENEKLLYKITSP